MIYFLVNNDYQYYDVLLHMDVLAAGASLIKVPHSLKRADADQLFKRTIVIRSPFAERGGVFRIRKVRRAIRGLDKELSVGPDDTLILYTEYELLNQFIVRLFKSRGARVVLVEDGGIATFLTFNITGPREKLSAMEKLREIFVKRLYGGDFVSMVKYNGLLFPQIEDRFIDAAAYYLPMPIARKIPRSVIHKRVDRVTGLGNGTVVFLNERIYDFYCDMKTYMDFLERALSQLERGFEQVLFKYHPSETLQRRSEIGRLVARHPRVSVLDRQDAIETLVQEYKPGHAVSFLSSALLNLWFYGVEPVFLHMLMPELKKQRIFVDLESLLQGSGCRTPKSLDEVQKSFTCGLSIPSQAAGTLSAVVAQVRSSRVAVGSGAL